MNKLFLNISKDASFFHHNSIFFKKNILGEIFSMSKKYHNFWGTYSTRVYNYLRLSTISMSLVPFAEQTIPLVF
jgi:hypothetical protein